MSPVSKNFENRCAKKSKKKKFGGEHRCRSGRGNSPFTVFLSDNNNDVAGKAKARNNVSERGVGVYAIASMWHVTISLLLQGNPSTAPGAADMSAWPSATALQPTGYYAGYDHPSLAAYG